MPDPWSRYLKGIYQKLKYYAAWPVNQPRMLGDVGLIVDGEFQRETSLKQLGIKFTERVGPPGRDISHTSGSSVSLKIKAEGQSLPGIDIPQANAGASVEFNSSGAFVFQAAKPVVREIENQSELGREILALFRKSKPGHGWKADWCVVTELLTADRVTVLVSNSKGSKVDLAAEGKIPVGGSAPLAAVKGSLSVVGQKGDVTSVLAEADLSPLFRVSRIKRSLLDKFLGTDENAEFGRAGIRSAGMPTRALENVSWDEAEEEPPPSEISKKSSAKAGAPKSIAGSKKLAKKTRKPVGRDRRKP